MANEKKTNTPQVVDPKPTTDLTEQHMARIEKFIEAGRPGLPDIEPAMIQRMSDLYLAGKNYTQISNIVRKEKDLVLYLGHQLEWFRHRQNYLEDLEQNMQLRVSEAKLMSQDFLLDLQAFFQKKIGKHVRRFQATDSDDIANEVNLKDIATYIKTLETLHKSMSNNQGESKAPAVSLNMGEGVTMKKNDDGSVEITPKQKASAEILKQFADLRREEEKK